MTRDELFLCTLEDLEGRLARLEPGGRVARSQQYELLMVASLLRKLLIDGGSLVAQVNRTRRLRLRYSVSGWPFASGTAMRGSRVDIRRGPRSPAKTPVIAQDQLAPELSGIIRERHLTLDQMLAEPVVTWNDVPITAKGLISYVANVGGGVHLGGQPKGRIEEALHTFGGDLSIDGYPIALAGVWDVGGVAISGLHPLRAAIESETGPAGMDG